MKIIDKTDYSEKMEDLLNETRKFGKTNPKNDEILNFAANQEELVGNILKQLVASKSISEKIRRSLNQLEPGQI